MKIKLYLFVFILISLISKSNAQKVEVGILGGGSYSYNDVVNDWNSVNVHSSFGMFVRNHISEKLCIRGQFMYVSIGGADSNSTTSQWQRNRNWSFWADIYELSGQLEYNLVNDITRGRILRNRVIPYIFGGLGFFYFENYANIPSMYVGGLYGYPATAKLWTLGDGGTFYSRYQICVPLGLGVRAKLTPNLSLGFELSMRLTTTSYLDDIAGPSESFLDPSKLKYSLSRYMVYGTPKNEGWALPGKPRGKVSITDMYFIGGVTLSYRFGKLGGSAGFRGHAIRCPRFY